MRSLIHIRSSVWPVAAAALIIIGLGLGGCGYHVSGKGGGGMPGGITELALPIFANETRKPDIEALVTSVFAEEFLTTVKVTDSATAKMLGSIKSYDLKAVSYSRDDVNQEYRLTVLFSLEIVSGEAVLWSDTAITDYEDFVVNTADVTATEEAEIAALKKLTRDTARLVKERMLENF
jgi:outer membrane lipopolysaccharide assembly protein LptE/RlpB